MTEIYQLTTTNRLMIADLLDSLSDRQWDTETLCRGWTVRHMAAHFVQPMLVGFGRFLLVSFRYRGNTDRTVDHFTKRLAGKPRTELITLLRTHAHDRIDPPRVGPMGPFAETCLHLRDIARPLGLPADVPVEHWRILLDYLVSPTVAPSLVRAGSLTGTSLKATDIDWTTGDGEIISGPAEAIAMAVTGRAAALADLRGPGLRRLCAARQTSGGTRSNP
ncbi:maleylpyruvate isomerase family mycothiol-dependent enzyme [Actinoplanes sp. NPDC051861]|uniref:maleylpyruvate isomerase family mycothiol-dependent enzyme n=1 Tax=Actinoplanes sp. NPDC051861 TaxID=3155170 RepID=UPI0034446F19